MESVKSTAEEMIEKLGLEHAKITVQYIINANPHSNPLNTQVHSTMEFWLELKNYLQIKNI